MTTHIKSINRKVWKVVETKIEIADRRIPPLPKKCFSKTMALLLVLFMMLLMREYLSKSRTSRWLMRHGRSWRNHLRAPKAIKGAKAYILKEKFANFKMKEDESVSDIFHRIEVLVNDLKAFGEKVEDKDFSHKFLRCLPARFGMLVTLLVRTGLDTMTPNQILGDIMTDDAYRDDDEKKKKGEEG
jgi:hypothetical protein